MPPLVIAGAIGAAGSIAGGVIGAKAAGHAADTQANAANNAAALERQSATDALNFNKLQYGNSLNLLSPFYNTGVAANSRLAYLMGLNPAQGLPAGVVNPNTPTSTGPTRAQQFGLGPDSGPAPALQAAPRGGSLTTAASMASPSGITSVAGPGGPFSLPGTGTVSLGGSGFGPPQFAGSTDPGQGAPAGLGPAQFAGAQDPGTVNASTGNAQLTVPNTGQAPVPGAGGDFGSLAQGWNQTFSSPTNVTEQNDPGYQFRLQQGQNALQNSAAARGGLLSGATAKSLADYNQNAASGEYQNVYNRALQNYNTNYNTFTNDQTNLFNRLQALNGGGQVTANNLSASGLTAANNAANIGLTSAGQIGQQLNNAGAATASGYIGGANAINGAIGGATNSLSSLALLRLLNGGGMNVDNNPYVTSGMVG